MTPQTISPAESRHGRLIAERKPREERRSILANIVQRERGSGLSARQMFHARASERLGLRP